MYCKSSIISFQTFTITENTLTEFLVFLIVVDWQQPTLCTLSRICGSVSAQCEHELCWHARNFLIRLKTWGIGKSESTVIWAQNQIIWSWHAYTCTKIYLEKQHFDLHRVVYFPENNRRISCTSACAVNKHTATILILKVLNKKAVSATQQLCFDSDMFTSFH